MAKFLITHEVTEEAETEEEALTSYVESWKDGFYSKDDVTIEEQEKGS